MIRITVQFSRNTRLNTSSSISTEHNGMICAARGFQCHTQLCNSLQFRNTESHVRFIDWRSKNIIINDCATKRHAYRTLRSGQQTVVPHQTTTLYTPVINKRYLVFRRSVNSRRSMCNYNTKVQDPNHLLTLSM